ncbi:MAG: YraN family protein [Acidobacteriota bacterium]
MHGENLACRELKRRGYIIEARRVRTSLGEIDVVARDGTALVFVEVKTRRSRGHGSPAEAVTRRKQRKLSVLARAYLARKNLGEVPVRFDVVAVDWSERDGPRVDIVRGAFQGLPD